MSAAASPSICTLLLLLLELLLLMPVDVLLLQLRLLLYLLLLLLLVVVVTVELRVALAARSVSSCWMSEPYQEHAIWIVSTAKKSMQGEGWGGDGAVGRVRFKAGWPTKSNGAKDCLCVSMPSGT
jgi:hypothetical protein